MGIRDPAGKILRLERDTDGRFVKITSPAGHWLEFEYGGNSITRIHDSRGRAVKYTYDARGRLTGVENPAG